MTTKSCVRESRIFKAPKLGNTEEEYEDASDRDEARALFAIADGASQSSDADLWAQLLVQGFVQGASYPLDRWQKWLPSRQQRWEQEVQKRWTTYATAEPVSIYMQSKFQEGAFATFLGLALAQKGSWYLRRHWQAVAIGDSCFFQVRRGKLLKTFPLLASKDFSNCPWLLGSRDVLDDQFKRKEKRGAGTWRPNDRFWIMTDALAEWFLREHEQNRKPWGKLDGLLTADQPDHAFMLLITDLRKEKVLRNDDVTLMVVCV
jgi:hypothetical protein